MITFPFQTEPDTALTSGVSDTEPENDESIVLVTTDLREHLLTSVSRSAGIIDCRGLLNSEEVSSKCYKNVNERKRGEIDTGRGEKSKEE